MSNLLSRLVDPQMVPIIVIYYGLGIHLVVHEFSHMIALWITDPSLRYVTTIIFSGKTARTYSNLYPCLIYYQKWKWIRFNGFAGLIGEVVVNAIIGGISFYIGGFAITLISIVYTVCRTYCTFNQTDEYSDGIAIFDPEKWKYKVYTKLCKCISLGLFHIGVEKPTSQN